MCIRDRSRRSCQIISCWPFISKIHRTILDSNLYAVFLCKLYNVRPDLEKFFPVSLRSLQPVFSYKRIYNLYTQFLRADDTLLDMLDCEDVYKRQTMDCPGILTLGVSLRLK